MDDATQDAIEELHAMLDRARVIVPFTGAGISTESGVPDFRSPGSPWMQNKPIPFEAFLASREARIEAWRRKFAMDDHYRDARPNRGHRALATLVAEGRSPGVITQNIDGLHQAAGSRNVIPIHGDVHHLRCEACGSREEVVSLEGRELPPVCPHCGEKMRPEVVLFGEMLPEEEITRFYDELERGFDLVFSIGTTSVFPYIARPVVWATQSGIPTVEINPSETKVTPYVTYKLPMGAAAAMTALLDRL